MIGLALLSATVAVVSASLGRLSAQRAIRHLRESLYWYDRLSGEHEIDLPRHARTRDPRFPRLRRFVSQWWALGVFTAAVVFVVWTVSA